MTPVYFGSALRILRRAGPDRRPDRLCTPATRPVAETRTVQADEAEDERLRLQNPANMDPNHRDRIAFLRVCSGRLTRGMKAKLVRTGKPMPLNAPQFFFAKDRQLAEEAYAGDIVGIPQPRHPAYRRHADRRRRYRLQGVPSFAPEQLRRVKLKDAMKAKKLREALQQMGEEGVVQLFIPHDARRPSSARRRPAARRAQGATGTRRYTLPVDFDPCQFLGLPVDQLPTTR